MCVHTSWSRWKWEGEFVGRVSLSFTHLADRSGLPSYSHPTTCHRKLPLQPYRTRFLRTTNLLLAFSAWREGGVQLFIVWEKALGSIPFEGGALMIKVYRVPQKGFSPKGPNQEGDLPISTHLPKPQKRYFISLSVIDRFEH